MEQVNKLDRLKSQALGILSRMSRAGEIYPQALFLYTGIYVKARLNLFDDTAMVLAK